MIRGEEKRPQPDERERLSRILKTAFPIEAPGSFTSLLQTLDPPNRKNPRK